VKTGKLERLTTSLLAATTLELPLVSAALGVNDDPQPTTYRQSAAMTPARPNPSLKVVVPITKGAYTKLCHPTSCVGA